MIKCLKHEDIVQLPSRVEYLSMPDNALWNKMRQRRIQKFNDILFIELKTILRTNTVSLYCILDAEGLQTVNSTPAKLIY